MEKRIYDEANGLYYTLEEDGMYYPKIELPEETRYDIGKYGLMRLEYLSKHCRTEYIRLLLSGMLNEHLHEVDEECYEILSMCKIFVRSCQKTVSDHKGLVKSYRRFSATI